jgi:hypothetical protein
MIRLGLFLSLLICFNSLFCENTNQKENSKIRSNFRLQFVEEKLDHLVIKCPANITELACQTQAEINAKFKAWLNSVTFEGGCNVVVTNNNTGSPPACGGSTSVKFTATSSCDPTVTCSASFAVVPSPSVVLLCPVNKTEAPCQSQAEIDSKFATWLASASYLGGCYAALSNDNLGAPSACGGSANVRFVVTTACEPPKTCISVFTVQSSPPVVLTCPANQVEDTGQTQSQINIKFAKWLNDYSFSGGCNAVISNNSTDAPSSKGGSRTVLFSIASGCEPNKTCKAKFSVNSGLVSTGGFNNPVDSTAGLNFLNNRYNSDRRKFVKQIEIEPNPVKGNGIIKIELFEKQLYRIDLINILGKTIWSTVDSKMQNQFEIEFSDYPAGLYFLVLSTDQSSKVLKWIVN